LGAGDHFRRGAGAEAGGAEEGQEDFVHEGCLPQEPRRGNLHVNRFGPGLFGVRRFKLGCKEVG
jgi:hypothetical protein